MKEASPSREKLTELLHRHGLRVTVPRMRILALLARARAPLAAEEIAERVRGTHLVTVYRTLEALARAGLLYRADFRDGRASYEYQAHHHHHVTCSDCGMKEPVEVCVRRQTQSALRETRHFASVDSHVLEFFGTCRSCARSSAKMA